MQIAGIWEQGFDPKCLKGCQKKSPKYLRTLELREALGSPRHYKLPRIPLPWISMDILNTILKVGWIWWGGDIQWSSEATYEFLECWHI